MVHHQPNPASTITVTIIIKINFNNNYNYNHNYSVILCILCIKDPKAMGQVSSKKGFRKDIREIGCTR